MAKVEIRSEFPGKAPAECYRACLALVDQAGYRLFKKREIANLVILNGNLDGNPVDLSLMVPFGSPTSVIVSLASEKADQAALAAEAERVMGLVSRAL